MPVFSKGDPNIPLDTNLYDHYFQQFQQFHKFIVHSNRFGRINKQGS